MKRPDVREPRSAPTKGLPKMMIAFVIRRCTVDLGHRPTAAELASWANNHTHGGESHCLFGRPISEREAHVILKHQSRLVSATSAAPDEAYVAEDAPLRPRAASGRVVPLSSARKPVTRARTARQRRG